MKYGNRRHYEWNTSLLEKTDSHIFVLGEYGRQLNHYTKQKVFTVEAWTIEYFSTESWFTVSADVVNGAIQHYYCNINLPAVMQGNTVSFIDLDLDYVFRNGEWKVVDEDEFIVNASKFHYPEDLIHRARQELLKLQELVAKKGFPFDGSLERFVERIPR
ncbi:DUF402 domain-containing protein [Paenibacillus sp. GCM10023248]|nr:DUF402 domain-containing protein [Bacillus sp. 3255]MDD9265540.1 DUF402 domain-containing protein [Paenibacillus sp. MAHUQ-63]